MWTRGCGLAASSSGTHRHLLVLEKVVYRLDLKPEAVFCNSFDQTNYIKVLWGGIELNFWFCSIIEKNDHPHFKNNSQLYSDLNSESHLGHYFFSWPLFLISFLNLPESLLLHVLFNLFFNSIPTITMPSHRTNTRSQWTPWELSVEGLSLALHQNLLALLQSCIR